jgi:hypothetical protein
MKKNYLAGLITILLTFGIAGLANATALLSDPTSTISYSGNTVTLHKELSGYGNYGIADNGSDILYSGDSGSWTFNLASFGLSPSDFSKASLTASLTLDDTSLPTYNYSMSINLLGADVFSGPTDTINLIHGSPHGSTFTNWTNVSFDSPTIADPFTVTMQNTTSSQSGWIGIDYIELKLTPVPLPASMLLFSTGLAGLIGTGARRKKRSNC